MEGYVSLVNMFLRTMVNSTQNPCLVNVSNTDGTFNEHSSDNGQIFYHSTIKFKETFTTLLGKQLKNFQTINVFTSFTDIKSSEISPWVASYLAS